MNRVSLLTFALVLGASAASAGANLNGISVNGLNINGLAFNGRSLNGISANGRTLNGISVNGRGLNGSNLNGTELNPGSGMSAHAESSDDTSPLVVQALTLADGTRLTVEPGH